MARSYKIKPDQLEEVHIYVDTRRGNLRVLHDVNLYRRATGNTDGDVPIFCFDESQHPDGLPEGVYKEVARFAPVNFSVSEEIDSETVYYEDNPANPAQPHIRVDLAKRTSMRIKYLLRSWSLSDSDPSLKLTTYTRPDGRIHLTNESLALINSQVEPKVIKGFMEAYEFWSRMSAQAVEKEAIDAVKEGSGGKIEVKN